MITQDIEVYRGDDETFSFTVKRANQPFDITGCKIWFTAKASVSDGDNIALIRKDTDTISGITITNAAEGKAELAILPVDTETITVPSAVAEKNKFEHVTALYYDIQLKTPDNKVFTISKGRLLVKPDITQTTT